MNCDLWTNKALDLEWVPTSPLWHSPMLLRAPCGGWKWYWRVDVSVVAWATRTLAKARAAGAELPGDPERSLRIIRGYLSEVDPDPASLTTVDTLASTTVRLPGDELIRDAAEFARFGLVPCF